MVEYNHPMLPLENQSAFRRALNLLIGFFKGIMNLLRLILRAIKRCLMKGFLTAVTRTELFVDFIILLTWSPFL